MRRRWLSAMAGGALALAGCGDSGGLAPVYGKVLYRGEPAKGATVYFHREGGAAPRGAPIPTGVVAEDGDFALSCDGVGSGAPPGRYVVLIEWNGGPAPPPPKRAKAKRARAIAPPRTALVYRPGNDRLRGRYLNIDRPVLHAEVRPGTNTIPPFELID